MSRMLVVVCVAMLAAACVGRPPEEATGEEIYLQLCSNCHGDDHQGGIGPSLGPGSNSAAQPEDFLRVTIEDGRGRMPSFRSALTDQQVDRLVMHLLEVQGR